MRPPRLGDSYWLARGICRPLAQTRTWARLYEYERRFWQWFSEWSGENAAFRAGERMGSYQGFKRGYRYGVAGGSGSPVPRGDDVENWWRLHDISIEWEKP